MKTTIIYVERNTFEDKKGNAVSYCKFGCLEPVEKNDNKVGCKVQYFTTKKENYDAIVEIYKKGASVNISFEYVEVIDNGKTLYRKKPTQIEDIKL